MEFILVYFIFISNAAKFPRERIGNCSFQSGRPINVQTVITKIRKIRCGSYIAS